MLQRYSQIACFLYLAESHLYSRESRFDEKNGDNPLWFIEITNAKSIMFTQLKKIGKHFGKDNVIIVEDYSHIPT
jgi:hypothetical protein